MVHVVTLPIVAPQACYTRRPDASSPRLLGEQLTVFPVVQFTTSTSSDSFDPASCRAVPVHLQVVLGVFILSWGRKLDILDCPSWSECL